MVRGTNAVAAMDIFVQASHRIEQASMTWTIVKEKENKQKDQHSDKQNLDVERTKHHYAIEEYYNVTDYLCAMYLSNELNRKTFWETLGMEMCRIRCDIDWLASVADAEIDLNSYRCINKVLDRIPESIWIDYEERLERLNNLDCKQRLALWMLQRDCSRQKVEDALRQIYQEQKMDEATACELVDRAWRFLTNLNLNSTNHQNICD